MATVINRLGIENWMDKKPILVPTMVGILALNPAHHNHELPSTNLVSVMEKQYI